MPPTDAETANPRDLTTSAHDAPPHREKVRFPSGNTTCAAWHYPGTTGRA